ncbi:spermidine synthase [Streptomyces aidingensis]|uniref:Spermidine synthase n=1 Tax=Streptomyces aidingensis TaxID=910347 RepID=A0A1I1TME8_9ACTN|nr:spermidine synthase [Streptomyces aidingensis]SFD59822.1 Spermidine synthase [Streptomyces aidingensis]
MVQQPHDSLSPLPPPLPPAPAAAGPAAPGPPEVLDRRPGPHGEVVLRRRDGRYEIIANGCFLMDTSDGRSERLLVRAALAAVDGAPGPARPAPSLLIGGLGVGFSLTEAVSEPRWGAITVVEREPAVIDWHRSGPLNPLTADALADPRTTVVHSGLLEHLRAPGPRYDVLCLDIDNGPDWTVTEDNGSLYSPSGLITCRFRLTPGGVLAVWSAAPSSRFEHALVNAGFRDVRTALVPVPRGVPDAVHLGTRAA